MPTALSKAGWGVWTVHVGVREQVTGNKKEWREKANESYYLLIQTLLVNVNINLMIMTLPLRSALFDPVAPQSNYTLNECAVHVLNIVGHKP